MSHYQSRGDRTDAAPLKKGVRGGSTGAGSQRGASFPTLKGGGAGGLSPSVSAPPISTPLPPNNVAASLAATPQARPSTPGTPPNKGRTNDPAESARGASGAASDLSSSTQQPAVLQSAQSPQQLQNQPFSGSSSSSKPVVKQLHSMEGPRPAVQPAYQFQFGSISPGFMNNSGLQIPARTSSAPPNLDEQKREKAQYEAARASASSKAQPTVFSGPQQRHGPPHLPPASSFSPHVQAHSQIHLQPKIQSEVSSQPPPQPRLHPPLPQPVPVQHQGTKFSQAIPSSQHAGQVLPSHVSNPMSGQLNHQLQPQMGHHLGPSASVPIGGQLPPGLPPPQYGPPVTSHIPQRTNKAVKIVNPNTHEELRFDSKVKKNEPSVDKMLPSGSFQGQVAARLSNNAPAQPRIGVSYGAAPHHQMNVNFYPGVQVGPYGPAGPPFYRPSLPPSGLPPPGAGLPSNPPLRYGFTPPQGMPYVNHSVAAAPGPTLSSPVVMGIGLSHPQGHGGADTGSVMPSNTPTQSSLIGLGPPTGKSVSITAPGRQGPLPIIRPPAVAGNQVGMDSKEKVAGVENGKLVRMDSGSSEGETLDTTTNSSNKSLARAPSREIVDSEQKVLATSQVTESVLHDVGRSLSSDPSDKTSEVLSAVRLEKTVNEECKNLEEVIPQKLLLGSADKELHSRSVMSTGNTEDLSSTLANDSVCGFNKKEKDVHSNSALEMNNPSSADCAAAVAKAPDFELNDNIFTSLSCLSTSEREDESEKVMIAQALKEQSSEVLEDQSSETSKDQVAEAFSLKDLLTDGQIMNDHLASIHEADVHREADPEAGSEMKPEMGQSCSEVSLTLSAEMDVCPALMPLSDTSLDLQVHTPLASGLPTIMEKECSDSEGLDVSLNSQSITLHSKTSSVEDLGLTPNSDQAESGLGNHLENPPVLDHLTEESYEAKDKSSNKQIAEETRDHVNLQVGSGTVSENLIADPECVKENLTVNPSANSHPQTDALSAGAEDCVVNSSATDASNISNPIQETDQTNIPGLGASHGSRRKKKKTLLAKADASGDSTDLFNAYKTSEERKEQKTKQFDSVSASKAVERINEHAPSEQFTKESDDRESMIVDVVVSERTNDAVDVSSQMIIPGNEMGVAHAENKKYTRDFLLSFKECCYDLPAHFEIRANISELLLNPESIPHGLSGELLTPGRNLDRQLSSSSHRLERRGSVVLGPDEDKWTRQPGGAPSSSVGYTDVHMDMAVPGSFGWFRSGQSLNAGLIARPVSRPGMPMLSPMMMGVISGAAMIPQMMGGNAAPIRTNGPDADRWQRAPMAQRGLIPSPHNALPAIHKAENKYEVGKVSDEEELKQRQIKAILNKLTPQNFDKLFEQVKEVHIDSAVTLTGVISQIFDKALLEPTFCEMYAKFCVRLSKDLPEFNEDGEKVTFKRVLLNKCQEEFERGEMEQQEAMKFTPEESEEKRVKARRRMLGNIRFIGELYKKSMLTERIMHECIKKLLGGYHNPDEEDVEALCKLMATIGRIIDHPKAKKHIDAYFDRMNELASDEKLSSRLRFMLKDVIDLRKNDWQERRKVEGPKKIDEVHRDAAYERQVQAGRDRPRGLSTMSSLSRRTAPPADFGVRAGPPSPMFPSPQLMGNMTPGGVRNLQPQTSLRSTFGQDVRMEDRLIENRPMPMPLSQRLVDDGPITLGPQGGLGRGPGMRFQPPASGRSALADIPPVIHGDLRRGVGPFPSMPGYPGGMSSERGPFVGRDDHMSTRSSNAERLERPLLERPVERFSHNILGRDLRSFERPLNENSFSNSSYQSTLMTSASSLVTALSQQFDDKQLREKTEIIINEYFSARDLEEVVRCVDELRSPQFHPTMVSTWVTRSLERKDTERDLLVKLLIHLSRVDPPLLFHEAITHGFESVLAELEDTKVDVPKAADYVADMIGNLISQDLLSLSRLGNLLKVGGIEPGSLISSGDAQQIFGIVLATLRREKGEAAMLDAYKISGISFEELLIGRDSAGGNLNAFLERWSLQCLNPKLSLPTAKGKRRYRISTVGGEQPQLWDMSVPKVPLRIQDYDEELDFHVMRHNKMAPFEKHLEEALDKNQEASEIFKWFEKNVPPTMMANGSLLRMLMTCVLKHCVSLVPSHQEMNAVKGQTRKYAPLLRLFSSGNAKSSEVSQRHYIAAVQLFVNDLGYPPGLMTSLFENLYNEEVISERAYKSWQDDVKDTTPGRDKAIREVSKWLAWLATAPEELGDED